MDLNNIDLLSLQTSYLQQDKTVQAICNALNPYFQLLADSVKYALIYARIDELNSEAIDELAWQFHVDFYDSDLSLDQKRNLVKNSIWWHKIKGTPQAVIEAVTSIFSNVELKEWFEYEGDPFYFSMDIDIIDEILTEENLKRVFDLINAYKNTRSWLEILKFHLHVKSTNNSYLGSTLVSTRHYKLTSDFNYNYSSENNNNVASKLVNSKYYELTNNIDEHIDLDANVNQASIQVKTMKYELS